jgi:hypothetical protein
MFIGIFFFFFAVAMMLGVWARTYYRRAKRAEHRNRLLVRALRSFGA